MQPESSASTCILHRHSGLPAAQHLIGREKDSPRAAWLAGLTESVNFRLSKRPCLDIYGREKTELRKTPAIYLCSAHSHSYMCVYTQTHTLTCAHTWERA